MTGQQWQPVQVPGISSLRYGDSLNRVAYVRIPRLPELPRVEFRRDEIRCNLSFASCMRICRDRFTLGLQLPRVTSRANRVKSRSRDSNRILPAARICLCIFSLDGRRAKNFRQK